MIKCKLLYSKKEIKRCIIKIKECSITNTEVISRSGHSTTIQIVEQNMNNGLLIIFK